MASIGDTQNALERVTSLCRNISFRKLCLGVNYGAAAYIYQPVTIASMELNSSQCLLLALLNSLVTADVMSCFLLANICQQVHQLRSNYLKVWLTEDFIFPRRDIEKAITLLDKLVAINGLRLPSHVMRIMFSVANKYGVAINEFTASYEEPYDLAVEMENAVSNNSPGDIITLVSVGGDVNGFTQSGDSLLHLAARTGNCTSIAVLGFLKADLEVVNSSFATPLEVAVRNNCVRSVKALLMAGAKHDRQLFRGDTFLHIAAAGGQNGVLEVLLDEGLEINIANHLHETPLFQATRAVNVRGVEILLERGADIGVVPEGSKSLFEMAVQSKNIALFKAFIKFKTLPVLESKDDDPILHRVARSGDVEMLKILRDLKMSAKIKNKNGATPLHVAANITILKMLFEMGSDVDAKDNTASTALMVATKNSKTDIFTFLLYNGANANIRDKDNLTPLHHASKEGCIEIVTALLEAGARVDETDDKGRTPAFVAAMNNKLSVLELLIEHGADINLKDKDNERIIHYAARCGYADIISLLLEAGVGVDIKGKSDYTPLHYAAEKGHLDVASLLINRGANPKAVTRTVSKSNSNSYNYNSREVIDSWTPLIAASKIGNLDIVKLLVLHNAPLNDRDTRCGNTALMWAVNNNHTSVADYLRSKGCHQ